jgi:hypothetical protein
MTRSIGITVFCFVCVLSYAPRWQQAPILVNDGQSYMDVAADLRDMRLSSLHDRTIGYPLLMLITGSTSTPSRGLFWAQLLLHAATLALIAHSISWLGAPTYVSLAAVLIGLLPTHVAWSTVTRTAVLTEFLITVAAVGVFRWMSVASRAWLLTAIAAFALLPVVRPTFTGLWVVLALLALVLPHRSPAGARYRQAMFLSAGAQLLVVTSIVLFNMVRFDFTGVTPLLGFNLCTRTAGIVERIDRRHEPIREILIAYRDQSLLAPDDDHTGRMYVWGAREALHEATGLSQAELSKRMFAINRELILSAPLHYAGTVVSSAAAFWLPAFPAVNIYSRPVQTVSMVAQFATSTLFLLICVICLGTVLMLWLLPGGRTPIMTSMNNQSAPAYWLYLVLNICIVLYTMIVSSTIDTGNPRYRVSVEPLIWLSIALSARIVCDLRLLTSGADGVSRVVSSPTRRPS